MSKINGKKVSKQNQLHDIVDWNIDNLVFADAEQGSVPNAEPPISFVRVNLLTQNHKLDEDGKIMYELDSEGNPTNIPLNDDSMGDAIFSFDRLFSFGVTETLSQETKAVTGHSMSFAMWGREGATEREIQTTRKIEAIVQKAKEHLLSIKKEGLKKPKLEMSDLKDMDKILYWKEDEDGNRVVGQGPTFSPKLIEFKARKDPKTGKEKPYSMSTVFYLEDEVDENGDPIEVSPLDFLSTKSEKRYCYGRPAVKFESIFFGAKVISIQCKITEADVALVQSGPQRLLHGRHKVKVNVNNKVTINTSKGVNPLLSSAPSKKDEVDEEKESSPKKSNELSDELTDDVPVEKPKVKKTVTKIVKKKPAEASE